MRLTISVVVCDHCQHPVCTQYVESYRVEDGPTLHICHTCQSQPFKKVVPASKRLAAAEVARLAIGLLGD